MSVKSNSLPTAPRIMTVPSNTLVGSAFILCSLIGVLCPISLVTKPAPGGWAGTVSMSSTSRDNRSARVPRTQEVFDKGWDSSAGSVLGHCSPLDML